jgi:hypothetical protein
VIGAEDRAGHVRGALEKIQALRGDLEVDVLDAIVNGQDGLEARARVILARDVEAHLAELVTA